MTPRNAPPTVQLVNEHRAISFHVGGHGVRPISADIHIVAHVARHEISQHDYGYGPEYECNCGKWEPGFDCAHLDAFRAEQERRITRQPREAVAA